ncbi:hypothetical protein BYT27DRAFT_7192513 [Phlegmacium glaucopus]|nr:hypothetical protein BYT27DRAFT_7192513 [Phlegmacium glaucopus]
MFDAPEELTQSPLLTNVIPGGKRKWVSSSVSGVEHSVSKSRSKKTRLETNRSPVCCSGSPEEFDHEGTGEEAEAVQSHVARPQPENADAELKRLQKDWTAPIYAFFKPTPTIEHIGGRRVHVFECIAETCKARGRKARQVNRYLDKADARSTSNLRKHAKMCWGTDIVEAADRTKNIETTRSIVAGIVSRNSSFSSVIEGAGKGKLSYILATPAH